MTRLMAVVFTVVMLQGAAFDHSYPQYAQLLRDYVQAPKVSYSGLTSDRALLDAAVAALAQPTVAEERGWTREQRLAFWINAYNLFTLRAVVDHFPIHGRPFSLSPRRSIRQIDGVWTALTWRAAGRTLTLDDIEHKILRPEFKDPRVHFAINCASVSCPVLPAEPYRAATLDAQLDAAARRYLASAEGLRIDGHTLRVSKILQWYGEDFVARFAPDRAGRPDRVVRAVLGVVARFGPPEAVALAKTSSVRVRFLDYDWSLNDVR